ncbi:MAG TPA: A24 family peptidase [Microvirga sp.]|nr:A24 family peptidase [Microvirga sp.]
MPSEGFLLFLSTIYLCCVLLVCTVVDLRRFVIPNRANAASLIGAMTYAVLSSRHALGPQMLGGLIGGSAFVAIAIAFRRIRHHDGLGLGDAKFMVGAGTWVGWQGVAPLVLAASLSALTYLLVRKIMDARFDPQDRIPFAPFLSLATLIVWCLQEHEAALWMG